MSILSIFLSGGEGMPLSKDTEAGLKCFSSCTRLKARGIWEKVSRVTRSVNSLIDSQSYDYLY